MPLSKLLHRSLLRLVSIQVQFNDLDSFSSITARGYTEILYDWFLSDNKAILWILLNLDNIYYHLIVWQWKCWRYHDTLVKGIIQKVYSMPDVSEISWNFNTNNCRVEKQVPGSGRDEEDQAVERMCNSCLLHNSFTQPFMRIPNGQLRCNWYTWSAELWILIIYVKQ